MASQESLETKQLAGEGKVVMRSGQDTPVAIRLRYVGGSTITSVDVTTGDNITLVSGSAVTDIYLFATAGNTTLGGVVDRINRDGRFEAVVLDSLRSAASASRLLTATVTARIDFDGKQFWDLRLDTSAGLQYAACLSPFKTFESRKKVTSVKLQEIQYLVNMGAAAADSVQIWKRKGAEETQIFGALSVDNTLTTINFDGGDGFISGDVDEEIIVLVKDAATLADSASNFLRVSGIRE